MAGMSGAVNPISDHPSAIRLSVIVAADERDDSLITCLRQLGEQDRGLDDVEVIIVGAAVSARAAEPWLPVAPRWLDGPATSPAAAWNTGAAVAVGDYCLFLTTDVMPAANLLATHLAAQGVSDQGCVAVGRARLTPSRWEATVPCAPIPSWHARDGDAHVSVPRLAFLRTGGFDPAVRWSVMDLAWRLEQAGLPAAAAPASASRLVAASWAARVAQAEDDGAASLMLYRRHPPVLPRLPLGAFGRTSSRGLLARRLLVSIGRRRLAHRVLLVALCSLARWPAWRDLVWDYAYWRGVRRVATPAEWRSLSRAPIVLMYHAIGAEGEPASAYVLPERRFRRQMAWLTWRGYRVLSLSDIVRARREHRLPPGRSVVLTFDDGYRDNLELACPILRRRHFPATIFMVTDAAGGANTWDRDGALAGRPLLSWAEARAVQSSGVEFGAHTRRHPPLTTVPPERLADEIVGSRLDLERALERPVAAFAYPHGRYDEATLAVTRAGGFLGACCSEGGVNDPAVDPYLVRRVEIRGDDSFVQFLLALWFGMRLTPGRLLRRLWHGS